MNYLTNGPISLHANSDLTQTSRSKYLDLVFNKKPSVGNDNIKYY